MPTEDLEILFGDLQKLLRDMAEIESDVEILPPPNDVTHKMKKKRSVIFKTFCPEEKKIIHIDHKIEKRLAPIWNDIIYVARGKNWHYRGQVQESREGPRVL